MIAGKLQSLETTKPELTVKKSSAAPWFIFTALITLTAAAAIFYGYKELEKTKKTNVLLEKQQTELATKNKELSNDLNSVKQQYNKSSLELQAVRKFQKTELEKQRNTFNNYLIELKTAARQNKNIQKKQQAALLDAKNKFTAMQKDYLQKISDLSNSNKSQSQTLIDYKKLLKNKKITL